MTPDCPQCRNGRHEDCDNTAWDDENGLVHCPCDQRNHQPKP